MRPPALSSPHEAALWLEEVLQNTEESIYVGDFEGVLPPEFDFQEVCSALEAVGGGVYCDGSPSTRRVRFNSASGGVYRDLAELLEHQKANQTELPARFALQDIGYRYAGDASTAPEGVRGYLDMVELAALVKGLADYATSAELYRHFVVRPDAKFRIRMQYEVADLRPIPCLRDFVRDFISSEYHSAEKSDIARDSIAEIVGAREEVSLGELASSFERISKSARTSYAMLLSKFSVASVRKEIDKQNLEDTLRLNKTFSEIQNQLLALPAALLIAGATIEVGKAYKNAAVLIGVTIFAILMWLLLQNQRSSVLAIRTEIDTRKANLKDQPDLVSAQYSEQFQALGVRVEKQLRTLMVVRGLVILALAVVLYAVVDSSNDGLLSGGVVALFRLVFCLHGSP